MQNIIINKNNLFCVIGHSFHNETSYELVLIRACHIADMFDIKLAKTSETWKMLYNIKPNYQITIFEFFSTLDEAEKYANQLIDLRKPMCNDQISEKENKNGRVRCITTGIEYQNASTAAKANGIPTSSMSNHLNGKTGYRTLRDKVFERIRE